MSKLILDNIQRSGGDVFAIPSTDGTNGQALVTDGSGGLSFATVTPDLKTVDGNSLFGTGDIVIEDKSIREGFNVVGTMVTSSSRDNVYSTGEWTSSGPWTTYYNDWNDANSRTQGWNMLVGDGVPNGTSNVYFVNDASEAGNERRELQFAVQNRVGNHHKDRFCYDNSTGNYSGITLRVLPIRNTTASSITRVISASRTGSGGNYGGHSTLLWTPTETGVPYSQVTGGAWTIVDSTNSTSESDYNIATISVTVPANTTVYLVNTSGWVYHTTYRYKDSNQFYNLDSFFTSDEDLICDMRALYTLAYGRVQGESNSSSNPHKWLNLTAELYGDR